MIDSIVKTKEEAEDIYLPKGFEILRKYLTRDPMEYLSDMTYYYKREEFRTMQSWHIPTLQLIKLIMEYGPILSVGAGRALTESLVEDKGGDIISTDMQPGLNCWKPIEKNFMKVKKMKADKAVIKYYDRNVFMAWPPCDLPMAKEVVDAMSPGQKLIYVGEGHGGCTGDNAFFKTLQSDFEEIKFVKHPSWFGIRDNVEIYVKK